MLLVDVVVKTYDARGEEILDEVITQGASSVSGASSAKERKRSRVRQSQRLLVRAGIRHEDRQEDR